MIDLNPRIPPRIVDRILWFAVTGTAMLLLWSAFAEYRDGFDSNKFGLIAGLTLLVLGVTATIWKWGPVLPCLLFGTAFASLLTSPMASSPMEREFKQLVPLIGAVIGALVGMLWERSRSETSNSCSDVGAVQLRPKLDEQADAPERQSRRI